MNCDETREYLNSYLDNEVNRREWQAVRRHLAVCSSCRAQMDELMLAQSSLRQVLQAGAGACVPAAGSWERLRGQLTQRKTAQEAGLNAPVNIFQSLRRFNGRLIAAGASVIAIAVTLALILPPMLGKDNQVPASASDIALASPAVQAALNGVIPLKIAVTDNFGATGIYRVVLTVPPEQAVIADVNMQTRKVSHVALQTASNITEQQIIETAEADVRVQAALNEGYFFNFDRIVQLYLEVPDESELIDVLRNSDAKPEEMVGFLGFLTLQNDPDSVFDRRRYDVVINASLDRVIVFSGPNKLGTPRPTKTPWPPYPPGLSRQDFVNDFDPGSVIGTKPGGRGPLPEERTPRHLAVAVFEDDNFPQVYGRYTWDVTDQDIENILAIASTDAHAQFLLAKGAHFATVRAWWIGTGFDIVNPDGTRTQVDGVLWTATVRIILDEICYRVEIIYKDGNGFAFPKDEGLRPKEFLEHDIVLP